MAPRSRYVLERPAPWVWVYAPGILHLGALGTRGVKEGVVKWRHRSRTDATGETPFRRGILGTHGLGKDQAIVDKGLAYARVKPRARMLALYYVAEQENRLVVGTTNRSEAMTGFVAKWGDAAADVEPILPLYKTQVRQLAEYLGVPDEMVRKAPSPDVLPGIVDEVALGIDFQTLDRVLDGRGRIWVGRGSCRYRSGFAAYQPSGFAIVLPAAPTMESGSR